MYFVILTSGLLHLVALLKTDMQLGKYVMKTDTTLWLDQVDQVVFVHLVVI